MGGDARLPKWPDGSYVRLMLARYLLGLSVFAAVAVLSARVWSWTR